MIWGDIVLSSFRGCAVMGLALLASAPAVGAERTITLAVENMYCAACPYTVQASLEAVSGVTEVSVSLEHRTAIVTYDDAAADVADLTAATTNAGYPSAPDD